jgi:hypothetical protein
MEFPHMCILLLQVMRQLSIEYAFNQRILECHAGRIHRLGRSSALLAQAIGLLTAFYR